MQCDSDVYVCDSSYRKPPVLKKAVSKIGYVYLEKSETAVKIKIDNNIILPKIYLKFNEEAKKLDKIKELYNFWIIVEQLSLF